MKVRLVVAGADHGYSFVIQARTLVGGLRNIGVEACMDDAIKISEADAVIGVGSYVDYELLVKSNKPAGTAKIVPWIVSDDRMTKYITEYNQLDLILTTSQHCKAIMTQAGIDAKRIKILPEAVDNNFWMKRPDDETKQIIKLININDGIDNSPIRHDVLNLKAKGIPILFTTGGDASSKGATEVIMALGNIYKNTGNNNWLYMIKTWPSAVSMIKSAAELELAKEMGIGDNIKYLVGEYSFEFLRALMNISDIYAAPSRSEGFGLPLVEAAMCGKPVITCEGTAAEETVVSGETGFISKSVTADGETTKANVAELETYLEQLIKNPELRLKMGKTGKEQAILKYSPEIVARQLINFIKENEP